MMALTSLVSKPPHATMWHRVPVATSECAALSGQATYASDISLIWNLGNPPSSGISKSLMILEITAKPISKIEKLSKQQPQNVSIAHSIESMTHTLRVSRERSLGLEDFGKEKGAFE
eukprot:2562149-Amphidinium_carterae.1